MNPLLVLVIVVAFIVGTFLGGFWLTGIIFGDDNDAGGAMVWIIAAACCLEAIVGAAWLIYSTYHYFF